MGVVDDLLAYVATVLATVTTKDTPDSIDPVDVGNIGTDLAETIMPYMERINQEDIDDGTGVPDDLNGQDGDRYYQNTPNGTIEWRKEGASWVSKATIGGGGFIPFDGMGITGVVVDLVAGTIELPDIENDFPAIHENGIIRGNFDQQFTGGAWYAADPLPEVTKDVDGKLLTALFTLGNINLIGLNGRIW